MDNRLWYEKFMSPSKLDNYIQFMTGELYKSYSAENPAPEYTIDKFVDSLFGQGITPESQHKMDAGTAAHKVLEYWYEMNSPSAETWAVDPSKNVPPIPTTWWDDSELNKNLANFTNVSGNWIVKLDGNYELTLPKTRESWVKGVIGGCNIIGKVDAIDESMVIDHKFTSKIVLETYFNSYQWRAYLCMTGLKKFTYNLFTVVVDEVYNLVTIKNYEPLNLGAYDSMQEDVSNLIINYKEDLFLIEAQIRAKAAELNLTHKYFGRD